MRRLLHVSWPGLSRPSTFNGLKFIGGLLAAFATVSPFAVAADCLSLSRPVTLTGRVIELALPGPPNYESAQKGDAHETYWFLRLDEPLCIQADVSREDDLGQDFRRIKIVQLLTLPEAFDAYRKLVGLRASIAGQLFEAETGHHRTVVLLEQPKLLQVLP